MRGTLVFVLVLFIAAGCSRPPVLEEDKFVEVYTDLVIAQDTTTLPDSNFHALKDTIFSRHGITEKQYNETLNFYNEDPQRWDAFFNKALERLERFKKQHEKKP